MNNQKFWTLAWLAISITGAITVISSFFAEYSHAILETGKACPVIFGTVIMTTGAFFAIWTVLGSSQEQTPPTRMDEIDIIGRCRSTAHLIIDCLLCPEEIPPCGKEGLARRIEDGIQLALGLKSIVTIECDGPYISDFFYSVTTAEGEVIEF